MMKRILAAAFLAVFMITAAHAQLPGPGGGPGGGGSSSSGGGSGSRSGGGAVAGQAVMSCIGGAAINLIAGSVSMGATHRREMTPREAIVSAANGCAPIIGGAIAGAMVKRDNPCTKAIARDAGIRHRNPRFNEEKLFRIANGQSPMPDQAEFDRRYHKAYNQPCTLGKAKVISKKKASKKAVTKPHAHKKKYARKSQIYF